MYARALMFGALVLMLVGCVTPRRIPLTQEQARPSEPLTAAQVPRPNPTNRGGGYAVDWIAWEYLECGAKWDQYCTLDVSLEAHPAWDACKPLYDRPSAGKGGPKWWVSMQDYNKVGFAMYVKGSWEPWNQWGSMIRVENVGMRLIERGSTLAQRKAAGCIEPPWKNW